MHSPDIPAPLDKNATPAAVAAHNEVLDRAIERYWRPEGSVRVSKKQLAECKVTFTTAAEEVYFFNVDWATMMDTDRVVEVRNYVLHITRMIQVLSQPKDKCSHSHCPLSCLQELQNTTLMSHLY
jgi:hypothetical protein